MDARNALLGVLCVAILGATLPRAAWADGDRGTRAEAAEYAGREAASPSAADFTGGCCPGGDEMIILAIILAPIIIPLIPVYLIYTAVEECIAHDTPRR